MPLQISRTAVDGVTWTPIPAPFEAAAFTLEIEEGVPYGYRSSAATPGTQRNVAGGVAVTRRSGLGPILSGSSPIYVQLADPAATGTAVTQWES